MQKNNHDVPGPAETNGFAHVVKMIKSAQQSAAISVS